MSEREQSNPVQKGGVSGSGPLVDVDMGLAYEFIASLGIYHERFWLEKAEFEYELGESWFQNIRTHCSQDMLKGLERFTLQSHSARCSIHSWTHLYGMVYDTPSPRDVPTFLAHLEALDPLEIRLHLLGYYGRDLRKITPLDVILQAVEGDQESLELFFKTAFSDDLLVQERIRELIGLDGQVMKETFLTLLWAWYEQVFRAQENQIQPILERDAASKRKAQATMSPDKLIELATNGILYEPEAGIRKVVLIPSFLGRPWNETPNYQDMKFFVYPVADEFVTGRTIPPIQLVRLYQALGDERRLQILKLLKMKSYSLQELADAFGIAKSTMHHHLGLLRTAGLVWVRSDEKVYCLRLETLPRISELLEAFLNDAE